METKNEEKVMTKPLREVVLETQQIEEQFERDAPYLLEQLADPARDDTSMIKMYARAVLALGKNCDELVELAQRESAE